MEEQESISYERQIDEIIEYNAQIATSVDDIRDFVSYGFVTAGIIIGLLLVILIAKGWTKNE